MMQIGTNRDWKSISTGGFVTGVLALRGDGTLWTWGDFNFYINGLWGHTNNPFPIQLCQESNWVAFGNVGWNSARNQAGESWVFFPFRSLPGADVPVASMARLDSSDSARAAVGPFFSNYWNWGEYEVEPGGTMWVSPFAWPMNPPLTQSNRFGQGSDWISVSGGFGTLIGVTSDGMLWTWGLDYGQERHYDLGERIGLVTEAITNAFVPGRPTPYDEWGGHHPQKKPRPLMRIVITN